MVGPLEGRVAVVTGGSRGIGAAVAMRLATDGATVAVTHPGSDGPEEVLAAIRTGGHQCSAVEADNTDPAAVRAAIQQIAESHGRLDILVNNAGVIRIAPIDEMDIADFDLHFAVNVRGAFVASQEAARHIRSGGRIIMIGSCTADRIPFVGGSAYAMSKAAIAGMARGIARDLGGRGITVNTVQPGPTDTSLNPAAGPNADVQQQMLAIERFARADEIAGLVAYLASDQAAFVTGASLTIDGGYNA
jgi:3-oxoacyl-[acyl-carrier protein] reductase